MRPLFAKIGASIIWPGIIASVLAFLLIIGIDLFIFPNIAILDNVGSWAGAITTSLLVGGLSILIGIRVRSSREFNLRLEQDRARMDELQRSLEAALRFNRELADSADEETLIKIALEAVTILARAEMSVFIFTDERNDSSLVTAYGRLPDSVLHEWEEKIKKVLPSQNCQDCSTYNVKSARECQPLEAPLEEDYSVHCLPLMRSGLRVGILDLFSSSGSPLDPHEIAFIEGLLNEMVFAIQSLRLRRQELNTLRQLQMLRTSQSDLHAQLGLLLDSLKRALEIDFVYLHLEPETPDTSYTIMFRGDRTWAEKQLVKDICDHVRRTNKQYYNNDNADELEGMTSVMALPLQLPEGQHLGVILVACSHCRKVQPYQISIMQGVASQAALLVENDHLISSLKYRMIVEERSRLAREIHDGLAQTLAFLKIETAQMQNQLAAGHLNKLADSLKENYQTLSDAYLDTREIIDNLRLAPENGLPDWLKQASREFEETSGLKIDLAIQSGHITTILPEVQVHLVRIVQEALSNIRKHADARRILISLYETKNHLVLEINDDGRGFEFQQVPVFSQYGLRGMHERADLIGAELLVSSEPHRGTTVHLEMPLNQQETPV